MYMYIDYDGYYYPKAIFSHIQLQFPDNLGNSLRVILLELTGPHKNQLLNDPDFIIYKNCKIWCCYNNIIKQYTHEEMYNYLLDLQTIKDGCGIVVRIKEKYLNTSDNIINK